MNTFRIEGTITTVLSENRWQELFNLWLGTDVFKPDVYLEDLPLFPNGEDLIELGKQETNYEIM